MTDDTRRVIHELASRGLRMPIGADLVLREHPDAEAIVLDGARLGAVVAEAANRFHTPLAIPLMNLTLEKAFLLDRLGVAGVDVHTHTFSAPPDPAAVDACMRRLGDPLPRETQAVVDAVRHVARRGDLVPVGMVIGPFSLLVKTIEDPITAVYMAGSGMKAEDSEEVATLEALLDLSLRTVLRSVTAQIDAGAKAIMVAEPAANVSYVSPRQIEAGSDVWDHHVMEPNRRLKALLDSRGVELVFHCCGETTDTMVRRFGELGPVMLSLGRSRKLWEDAALVPESTVLYGNLPSRQFMGESPSAAEVRLMAGELSRKMAETRHPFILGSECDVLSVPGKERIIMEKVMAFVEAGGMSR